MSSTLNTIDFSVLQNQRDIGLWLENGRNLGSLQKAFHAQANIFRGVCTDVGAGSGIRTGNCSALNFLGVAQPEVRGLLLIIGPSALAVTNGNSDKGFLLSKTGGGEGSLQETFAGGRGLRIITSPLALNERFDYTITAPSGSQSATDGVQVMFLIDRGEGKLDVMGVVEHNDFLP